jgi:hypothetical protein
MGETMLKSKKFLISLIVIVAIVASYYFIPLSADEVFPGVNKIDKIYLGHARGANGEPFNYENIPIEDPSKLNAFSTILSGVKYSRIVKKDILNPHRFFSFSVNYTTKDGGLQNYHFTINEKGDLHVYLNERYFKINNDEGEKVFKQLEEFVLESEIDKAKPINHQPFTKKSEFTYLEEISDKKLEKYDLFLKDGFIHHLTEFTPEEIVLIYMNLVFEHNVERLHTLIYDNGQLPPVDPFRDEYDGKISNSLEQDYLKFRFYDSIEVVEETKKADDLSVQLKIVFGKTTHIVAYGLKKQDDVWKMDVYPWYEKLKSEQD